MHGGLRQAHGFGLTNGFVERSVGALARFIRGHVVRSLEQYGIDLGQVHEFHDLHFLACLRRDRVQFFVLEDNVAALFVFRAFHEF